MTSAPHSELTVVGVRQEPDGSVRLLTNDGREFACRSPQELWNDVLRIASGNAGARALPGAPGAEPARRTHRVRASVVPPTRQVGGIDEGQLRQAASDAADVVEEAAAQEYGALGRIGAQLLRQHGPTIARNFSPRGRRRMKRGRS